MFFKSSSILITTLALNILVLTITKQSNASVPSKELHTLVMNSLKMFQDKFERTKKLTGEEINLVRVLFNILNKRKEELEKEVQETEYWHLRQGR